jgi:spermidine synthase
VDASTPDLWLTECPSAHEKHHFSLKSVLFSGRTKFHQVSIVESHAYGKMLIIDGCVQSSESDEHVYHEALVHPAMVAHPRPNSVLIVGGGEGATLREVLRHPSVQSVVMVDIDSELVEKCHKLLPDWHRGAFDDPRVELVFADGADFIARTRRSFDVAIVDVCDASGVAPAASIYRDSFYVSLRRHLGSNATLAVQAMELSTMSCHDHINVLRGLRSTFVNAVSYATFIPSFWSLWGFVVASDAVDVSHFTPNEIDQILVDRGITLQHYDGGTHMNLFSLPKGIRTALGQ